VQKKKNRPCWNPESMNEVQFNANNLKQQIQTSKSQETKGNFLHYNYKLDWSKKIFSCFHQLSNPRFRVRAKDLDQKLNSVHMHSEHGILHSGQFKYIHKSQQLRYELAPARC
jgi:hypothetical protein